MKCRVGDKVRFLNDVGGGKVTRIEKNTVYVLGADGFEIPVLAAEVIVIDQATDSSIQKNTVSQFENGDDNNKSVQSQDAYIPEAQAFDEINFANQDDEVDPDGDLLGLFLGFVPENQINRTEVNQSLYIINDSPYRVFVTISKWQETLLKPLYAGFMYPETKQHVSTLKKDEINNEITLNIQSIFFKNRGFTPKQPEYFDIRLNPTKFYKKGSFTANDFFDEDAIILASADTKKDEILKSLTDKAIDQSIKQKDTNIKFVKKEKKPAVEEVDLHIEELVDNPKDLKPGEILDIQLSRFKVALEGAIIAKSRKIVFIHGVGNGKLKHELRKELEKNYPKLRYQDASFREYGYGATMVFVR